MLFIKIKQIIYLNIQLTFCDKSWSGIQPTFIIKKKKSFEKIASFFPHKHEHIQSPYTRLNGSVKTFRTQKVVARLIKKLVLQNYGSVFERETGIKRLRKK